MGTAVGCSLFLPGIEYVFRGNLFPEEMEMRFLISLVFLLPLLAGCVTMERLDSVQSTGEKLMDSTVMATTMPEGSLLT